VRVPFVPTAENIAQSLLAAARRTVAGVEVVRVRLQETPTAWAEVE
jgi:hypothetical protein